MRAVIAGLLCATFFVVGQVAAQDDVAEEDLLYPMGLVALYEQPGGKQVSRIDRQIAFVWKQRAADPRLLPGHFTASWQGRLLSQIEGSYRLAVYVGGRVSVQLSGKQVLQADATEPHWVVSDPLPLQLDWHPIEIQYESLGSEPRLTLFWVGPGFSLEPIGPRQLYHEPPAHTEQLEQSKQFARGATLSRALRCDACHGRNELADDSMLSVPSLRHLGGNVRPEWLIRWLQKHDGNESITSSAREPTDRVRISRRMPDFNLSRSEAAQVAEYLLADRSGDELADVQEQSPAAELQQEGLDLLLSLGCLACHEHNGLGRSDVLAGGDLSQVGDKRPAQFFERWLNDPASINPNHRMPVFQLSDHQRDALAALLASSRAAQQPEPAAESVSREQNAEQQTAARQRGAELFQQLACANCHRDGQSQATVPHTAPLSGSSRWDRSCAGRPDRRHNRPGYRLAAPDQRALQVYYSELALSSGVAAPQRTLEQLLRERGCVGCHARDDDPGLAARLPAIIEHHPAWAPLTPALAPPSLNSVGDKLHEHALRRAILQPHETARRPWLHVRMPRYSFTAEQIDELIQALIDADRIPDDAPLEYELSDIEVPPHEAARLVTSDGFGCTSCHVVGSSKPPPAVLNALGPDLLMLDQRIRRPWFERWVRNPARIVPRMEMPSVQTPVPGVLGNDLAQQLAAVWHALNQPDFKPPAPNPVRVVRRANIAELAERAVYVTDVTKVDDRTYIKPLIVGLPNRHNLLFDLDQARLAHWWLGDTARERTLGKTWYWEIGAPDVAPLDAETAEFGLAFSDGNVVVPEREGQFVTELDQLRQVDGGLQLHHRLRFRNGDRRHVLRITQRFLGAAGTNDWQREIVAEPLPAGARLVLHLGADQSGSPMHVTDNMLTFAGEFGARIQIEDDQNSRLDGQGRLWVSANDRGRARTVLRYATSTAPDIFAPVAVPPTVLQPEVLQAVPGFEAVRLPLPSDIMPTGMAWDDDGRMIVSSLKGEVLAARDSDGDGLMDSIAPICHDLAAPYGVAIHGQYVDVVNKYALLRLVDEDDDGFCERVINVASGWGHTDDYHDWAVGLPHDGQGGYYIALPCQQDDRNAAAAHLRGTLVHLVPREPDANDPRYFSLEVVSTGHRFPMGLARRHDGHLWVTDNQGNYNPFNELNHVVPGADYGFINAIDRKRTGPRPPLTEPAINIPHPWTRSVNGICVLESPDGQHSRFGPFAGHLVGCEYDSRRLIRMSVQQVGDTMQGAAYPLSVYQPDGATFLGPIVCSVAPDGNVYIGCIRDSGWGGANNIGGIVRLAPRLAELPAGIAEMRATADGFELKFTRPVARNRALQSDNYVLSSYRRISTPDYGGPDTDRRSESLAAIEMPSDDTVQLKLANELRAGHVYELHTRNLSGDGETFFPAEAHYTLRRIPPPQEK